MSVAALEPVPYADARDHLVDLLTQIAFALDRAAAGDPRIADASATHDAAIAERVAATAIALPVVELARRFGLDGLEVRILVAAALPGLDVALAERWQRQLTTSEPERRVFEVVELLAAGHPRAAVIDALAADRPLRRSQLVRLTSGREWMREAPLLQQRIGVRDRVVEALRGNRGFDPRLAAVARRIPPAPGAAPPGLVEALVAASPLLVGGPALAGKTTAVAAAAGTLGRGAIVADLDVIGVHHDAGCWLDDLRCEARLLGDVLVLRAGDGIDALPVPVQRAVYELVNRDAAVLTARHPERAIRHLRRPRTIHVEVPDGVAQEAIWRAQLGDRAIDLAPIVASFPLPAGEIAEAAAAARCEAVRAGRDVVAADLVTAARTRLQHRLGDVASLVTASLDWSDLVVREDVMQRITEVIAAARHREQVLDTWGFGAKLPYGRSNSALFAGPPGTGKTMIATLIAKELGLELFRIDLSKVVSKWIGETEKNLAKVFDEAARVHAALLFDEADALFAKRTEVRSSNDRNANLEVNYLLQRLEQYDGVVLLTTNAASSIDEAFQRRLRFRIELAAPDARERAALWRSMIPRSAPLAGDVDFHTIAERFTMAGGHIKNAAVRAAFMTAARGIAAIDQQTLLQAATLEWIELGNLPS